MLKLCDWESRLVCLLYVRKNCSHDVIPEDNIQILMGRTVARELSPHNGEPGVASCEIRGGRSGAGAGYFPSCFFGFALLIIILPFHHIRVLLTPETCDSPEQAAHYHILGL
jgi:hypothetical protein